MSVLSIFLIVAIIGLFLLGAGTGKLGENGPKIGFGMAILLAVVIALGWLGII